MDTYTSINTPEGMRLNVRLVNEGENYGPRRVFVCDTKGSILEFFDAEQEDVPGFDPLGKFVVLYHVSSLMDQRALLSEGMDIHGQLSSFHLSGENVHEILSWLDKQSWKPYSIVN